MADQIVDGARSAGDTRLQFLHSHGGPFFDLQRRLRLLHEKSLRTGVRALVFVALAWGMPLLLTLASLHGGQPGVWSYLSDPGPWARFFVAIAAFIIAEQAVETALHRKLEHFTRAPLLAPEAFDQAMVALTSALRRRDSGMAEIVCFVLAVASALLAFSTFAQLPASTWAAVVTREGHSLTAAGWWASCVSIPLFVFVLLRGIWRHFVWAALLREIASLKLRLVATHPDGKGGLAFLADYPNAYVLFVFGISSGLAAAVAKHLMQADLSATTLTTIMGCWLAIVFAFFAYPLSAFSKPLAALKDRSLLALAANATRQQRAAERKAVGMNIVAPDPREAEQSLELADVAKQYEQTRKLSTMLVNRNTLLPVAAAALVPFAIAGATKLPYKEVFSVLKKLLLI